MDFDDEQQVHAHVGIHTNNSEDHPQCVADHAVDGVALVGTMTAALIVVADDTSLTNCK